MTVASRLFYASEPFVTKMGCICTRVGNLLYVRPVQLPRTLKQQTMDKQVFPYFDGSLILTGPGTCAGYVMDFSGRGAFDPSGLLDAFTPEQIEAHNRTLGAAEIEAMSAKGIGVLYLTHSAEGWTVTNWSGSWKVRAYVTSGRHNIARVQRSVHFTGPDGKRWAGRQYGDNGQNFTAKRLKA